VSRRFLSLGPNAHDLIKGTLGHLFSREERVVFNGKSVRLVRGSAEVGKLASLFEGKFMGNGTLRNKHPPPGVWPKEMSDLDPPFVEHLARGRKLALAPIDHDQVGPGLERQILLLFLVREKGEFVVQFLVFSSNLSHIFPTPRGV